MTQPIELYKTVIKDFNYPFFVLACAHKENLRELKISTQHGIRCTDFNQKCKTLFEAFTIDHEYSRQSVEEYFAVKLCLLRVENGVIRSFEEVPAIGNNVIYVHRRLMP